MPYISVEYDRTQSAVLNEVVAKLGMERERALNPRVLHLGQEQKIAVH